VRKNRQLELPRRLVSPNSTPPGCTGK